MASPLLNYAYCSGSEYVFSFTVPAFTSIAYSLGAWMALRFGRTKQFNLS